MNTDYNPTQYTDAEVEASIHAVLNAFAADSPFGAAAGYTEAEHVLECLERGEVDGLTFGAPNACSCLIGSALRARHDIPGLRVAGRPDLPWEIDDESDDEIRWKNRFGAQLIDLYDHLDSLAAQDLFKNIRPGHSASVHAPARFAHDSIQHWLNARQQVIPEAIVVAQDFSAREIESIFKEVKP